MSYRLNNGRRIMSRSLKGILAIGVAVNALGAVPALAQDTPTGEQAAPAEDDSGVIMVTAQRREQSIDSVGISITAISGEDLSAQGITDARGIAAQTPGLMFDGGSGQGVNAFVTIRGVAQVDYSEHQEMPNAVYLDDVYVPTTSMVGFPLYDVERVEALRGPQGTLFGRNSTGGLLHFVTREPDNYLNGYGDVRYGNYNRVFAEGAVGGPISENVRFRVAGFLQNGDGYLQNMNPAAGDNEDGFEQEAWGIRARLQFDVADWTVTATGSLNRSPRHVEGAYKGLPGFFDATIGEPRYLPADMVLPVDLQFFGPVGPGEDPFGYRDPFEDAHVTSFNSSEGSLKKRYDYVTLKIEGPISDSIDFTSISNYSEGVIDYSEDSDGTPNQYFNYRSFGDTQQISQELRLNGDAANLNWTLGAYFLDLTGTYGSDFDFIVFDTLYPNRFEQQTRSYAIFGQVEYELTDRIKATAGLRYTRDRKHFESVAFEIYPGCDVDYGEPTCQNYDFTDASVGDLTRQSSGDVAGKIGLDFQASDDVLLYVSASRGIRGAGFNATADGYLPIARTRFDNERVHAFEGGAKINLFDGLANFRTSAFYYDYKDYQGFNFNGISSSVSSNDAEFYGGEAELYARPWEGANIGLGLALLETTVYDVVTGSGLRDVENVKAPGLTFNGSFAQEFDLGEFQGSFRYDFDYVGNHKANLAPSEITFIPGSWMHNLRVGLGQEQEGWEVYGFVQNLFNTDRKTFGYDNTFAAVTLASYAPPRMYGIGLHKEF